MTGDTGRAVSSPPHGGFGDGAAAEARWMRGLIVGVLLLAGLAAHVLLRWWPPLAGQPG
ncbi:hypothetical protein [Neoroseomonas soli]|uniref:Uncharacterized protein n=1 Tax=Neoroseomonas soli TaxID=1081025 RepID=A0A9X9WSX5_9PROT|nr:hypothetical protein [Neoroseomonas soli]MBR0670254.1 hypothetical protein [Neoroseomonas soli]